MQKNEHDHTLSVFEFFYTTALTSHSFDTIVLFHYINIVPTHKQHLN